MRQSVDVRTHVLSHNRPKYAVSNWLICHHIAHTGLMVVAGVFDRADGGLYPALAVELVARNRAAYTAVAVEVVDECRLAEPLIGWQAGDGVRAERFLIDRITAVILDLRRLLPGVERSAEGGG